MPKRNKSLKNKNLKKRQGPDLVALDEMLRCLRKCAPHVATPSGGWVRAIREGLGMTNVQLAERLGKVPQSIEDMQKSEMAGSIKLRSLRSLAEALGCQFVYALVPPKSLLKMRNEQAHIIASHVMASINRSVGAGKRYSAGGDASEKELQRLIKKVLAGNPKMLWK
jgi:predicted DNA-binding mobile mystery protein A